MNFSDSLLVEFMNKKDIGHPFLLITTMELLKNVDYFILNQIILVLKCCHTECWRYSRYNARINETLEKFILKIKIWYKNILKSSIKIIRYCQMRWNLLFFVSKFLCLSGYELSKKGYLISLTIFPIVSKDGSVVFHNSHNNEGSTIIKKSKWQLYILHFLHKNDAI